MEKNIDLYVHQNDISKYDHKKYTRNFTKSKEDIEYDMKVLKGYVDRLENTSSTVEECIFKIKDEDYFDVLELYSELYEDENHWVCVRI